MPEYSQGRCKMVSLIYKIILCSIMVVNYVNFWLITSDVPICIDIGELKSVLILNVIQIVLCVALTINSRIKKKVNIVIFTLEIFFLYLWIICARSINLYASVNYYKFVVLFSIGCLATGVLCNIYLFWKKLYRQ